jgi:hypothetical protein
MVKALAAARKSYGAWFGEYPWTNLRVTQFPGLAGYAQGFPGNISFSEGIGYLAKPIGGVEGENGEDADTLDVAFYIVAHEAGHQWWGNIVMPGKGPGGNIISEGLAEFSRARRCGAAGSAPTPSAAAPTTSARSTAPTARAQATR